MPKTRYDTIYIMILGGRTAQLSRQQEYYFIHTCLSFHLNRTDVMVQFSSSSSSPKEDNALMAFTVWTGWHVLSVRLRKKHREMEVETSQSKQELEELDVGVTWTSMNIKVKKQGFGSSLWIGDAEFLFALCLLCFGFTLLPDGTWRDDVRNHSRVLCSAAAWWLVAFSSILSLLLTRRAKK